MYAVGVAQPVSADFAVQQRVVDRVKNAIADAAHNCKRGQHPVTGADGIAKCSSTQQRQARKQDRPGAVAVNPKTRHRLRGTRHPKKQRQQKSQFGVAHAKFSFKPREKRRQQQLAEVADKVRNTYQAHHVGIGAQGGANRRSGRTGSRFVRGSRNNSGHASW